VSVVLAGLGVERREKREERRELFGKFGAKELNTQ
jgi:hypothetical protein